MSTSLTSKICCRIIGPQDNSFCEIAGQSMSLTSVHGCPVFNLQTTLAVLIKLSTYVLHSNVSCRIAFLGDASDCSEIHLLSRNKKVCVCVCVCVCKTAGFSCAQEMWLCPYEEVLGKFLRSDRVFLNMMPTL